MCNHDWEYFILGVLDSYGGKIHERYRHCRICGQYQKDSAYSMRDRIPSPQWINCLRPREMGKETTYLEREKKMAEEPLTVSPTRTYVVVTHDIVCVNEARFEKIILPESFSNNSKNAKYYYQSNNKDRASIIIACVAFEDYIATVTDVVEDVMFEKPKTDNKIRHFDTRSTSLSEDMKNVRQMLDAWNDEQDHPSTTYTMILKTVLYKLDFQSKFVAELKKELLNL